MVPVSIVLMVPVSIVLQLVAIQNVVKVVKNVGQKAHRQTADIQQQTHSAVVIPF
jgi:hypothetical protein